MVGTGLDRAVKNEQPLDQAMDRYAKGQDAAFGIIYLGLRDRLRTFLTRLTGAPAVADDLLQETSCASTARGALSRAGQRSVPLGLCDRPQRLARSRTFGQGARQGRVQQLDSDEPRFPEPATGPEADSEQAVIARQTAALVERVLAALPGPNVRRSC